jgi:hypothetical protein
MEGIPDNRRAMAILLHLKVMAKKSPDRIEAWKLERETRFELATPTLARLCSTS